PHADVFVCEATWQGDAQVYPPELHLVARDAGRIATQAGARQLVLTHIAGGLDVAVSAREAAETFDGPIVAAADLDTFPIGA
ncbi:MAG: hypothetical protein WD011_00495, partial [Nitriliruptoraceae bacterium]